jgi:hypothetical protein
MSRELINTLRQTAASFGISNVALLLAEAATALEAAEKEAGTPVAWRHVGIAGPYRAATTAAPEIAEAWRESGWTAERLFAHSAPLTPDERAEVITVLKRFVDADDGAAVHDDECTCGFFNAPDAMLIAYGDLRAARALKDKLEGKG